MTKTCSIGGCTNPAYRRGWCDKHYKRWRRHGDVHFVTPGREAHQFHGFTLYSTRGIVYATAERDRIRAMPVIQSVAAYDALHATQDARDAVRAAADAARYPWLFPTDTLISERAA